MTLLAAGFRPHYYPQSSKSHFDLAWITSIKSLLLCNPDRLGAGHAIITALEKAFKAGNHPQYLLPGMSLVTEAAGTN